MKRPWVLLSAVLISVSLLGSCTPCDDEPESRFQSLSGPYLGQHPPGMKPELFAPGLLSDGLFNGLVYFAAGGTEVFFNSGFEKPFYFSVLFHSQMRDGSWTEPEEFPVDRFIFHRPVLGPEGNRVYFLSHEVEEQVGDEERLTRIYYVERTGDGWSPPRVIDFGEEFPHDCSQTSVAANGNLYFQAGYSIDGDADIYFSRYEDGEYSKPEELSEAVNGPQHDVHPFVAPDESYLIFDGQRPEGLGQHDLYISFRDSRGAWTQAVNMGPSVNSERDERRASVSSDGKYLFFESKTADAKSRLPEQPFTLSELQEFVGSAENGGSDVYWVDARVIEELRP